MFLITSSFIWLLITFSKEYKSYIIYSLEYVNIPQDMLLQEVPQKKIKFLVKGSGFKILSSNFKSKKIKINTTTLKRAKNSLYYVLVRDQLKKMESQIHSGLEILDVERDTLFLNLGSLVSKMIPVKPNLNIEYHIGYDLLNDIVLEPDSILISGPEDQINSLSTINLETLSLKDIKSNFSREVNVQTPKNKQGLRYQEATVKVSGTVDKFTEGTLNIPFSVINVPDSLNITTLKESLEVKFVVALTNFNKVTQSSLKIECDYLYTLENNLNYLVPKLTTKPNFIKSYKIVPNKIDFLIRK